MYQNFFLKQKKEKKKEKKKNTPSCCHKEILSPLPLFLPSPHFKKENNEEHRKRKWTTYAQLRA